MIENTKDNKILRWWAKYRNYVLIGFKIGITLFLIMSIVFFVDINEIVLSLKEADLSLLFIPTLLSIFNIYLQYLKWNLTCKIILSETNGKKNFISLFYGFTAGVFTPIRIGEYFGRAIAYRDKSIIQITIATLIDKYFPLLIVVLFGSISSVIFLYLFEGITIYLSASLILVLLVLFYFIILLLFEESFWDNFIFNKLRRSKRLYPLLKYLKPLKGLDKRYTAKMIFISFLFYACFLIQFAFLIAAFSHHTNYLDYLWIGNLVMFSKTIIPPVSIGEMGVREGASVYFAGRFGELAAVGFNASIFLFMINVLIPSLIGLFLFLRKVDD
ncbi:MAG: flippase-like domain-containing protein [Ignavibacteriaceae bacterium]|nr:flippase-like domain-containing protein [Ignavibacteriaceae bacterium]